jgi:glycosyltransferase involved in cell wall biosynthesis
MNIAIFASAFHPSLGGVEELCRQLAHELRSRGHEVIILTNRWPRSLSRFEVFEGIPLYRVAFRMPETGLRSRFSYALTHRMIRRELAEILIRHKIEVMHVQCVSSNAHYAVEARRELGLPLVVTLQGELTMDASGLYQRSERAREVLRQAMTDAEIVTGCSARTLRDAEVFLGMSVGERGRAIFNAARIEDFEGVEPYIHNRPYIFALGRLAAQKGFDILLQAVAALRDSYDLLLAGEGEEQNALQELSRSLELEKRVHFVGRARRKEVAGYFKGCEFFVLPSTADEGLPVVCAEAMAAGKAIVATDSGGTAEAVLDGVNGLIVPKGDLQALLSAMTRMSEDTNFRQAAEQASATRANEFRWSAIADLYELAYRDAQRAAAGLELSLPMGSVR